MRGADVRDVERGLDRAAGKPMKKWMMSVIPLADALIACCVYPAAWLLKMVRKAGIYRLPHCKKALLQIGIFPIRNHYYEPQFDYRVSRGSAPQPRRLPGIDWNVAGQLSLLARFTFAQELEGTPQRKRGGLEFYSDNGYFVPGDAEYWYQLIRLIKPARIFEVGSGHSTLMAALAIRTNRESEPNYRCKHVCIEPYEAPWLEQLDVLVVRKKVEDVGVLLFAELGMNDILFVDSSHMIRPSGDVLFEYLELLPTLQVGVIVHLHDIFSPNDYPRRWIEDEVRFWNEQYLLEAFLSGSSTWRIVGALNYLHHHYFQELKSVAPLLRPDSEPGSFYIQKIA
jgi:Methyltransferase domain